MHVCVFFFPKNFPHVQGVGLKLDDALAFWKAEFSQKVSMVLLKYFVNMFSFAFSSYAYTLSHQLQIGKKHQFQL
jgi:hypothetical protein